MSSPGRLTDDELVEVEPGIFLARRAARAYRRVKANFAYHGDHFQIANNFAAYRDAELQHALHVAGGPTGTREMREFYKLNPDSEVYIADDPLGSHQDGRSLDFLINWSSAYPNEERRRRLAHFGWLFQFGPNDPNHVRHDNIRGTIPVTRAWCIKHDIWVQPSK